MIRHPVEIILLTIASVIIYKKCEVLNREISFFNDYL